MRRGRFLTRIARWIARVLSGMANRIDRTRISPAPGPARPDQALAALAERFPGAPEHWLRAVAARMPVPSATDRPQQLGHLPARPPARAVPARPDPVPALTAPHPALPSHRVRPAQVLRQQIAARRSHARLLLPGLWRRLQVPFNLLARGQLRSLRPDPAFIGEAPAASLHPTSEAIPSAPQSRHEQRQQLLFGSPANDDAAKSGPGYPEPWFDTQSEFEEWVASRFGRALPTDPSLMPSAYSMPADEPHHAAMWPTIAPVETRDWSQFPEAGQARQRPAFVAIGDERPGLWHQRSAIRTPFAVTQWPELPPSDAFIADAEPSPTSHDALRYEQTVGRWSA